MSFQLATAAKHFVVNADAAPKVITMVDFQIDPATAGQQPTAVQDIMVRTRNNSISGPDLFACWYSSGQDAVFQD